MRRKVKEQIDEEIIDAEEEGLIAERWSIAKIVTGLLILLVIIGIGAYAFLYYKRYQESRGNNILGIQETREEPQLPTEADVEQTLETVQEEIEKIDPGNLFSSQQSIQRIIQDLESLRNGATDPKGAFCSAVCGSSGEIEKDQKNASEEAEKNNE